MARRLHRERHKIGNTGWLRAAVLGANDGVLSTASLILGVLESFGGVYLSYQYRDTFGLVILILVLLFRPQGLFGERRREV